MTFLEKVDDLAKTIGSKAEEAAEYTKLNTKILMEKNNIKDEYRRLGELVYQLYLQGVTLETESLNICQMIDNHNEIIKKAQQQLDASKK